MRTVQVSIHVECFGNQVPEDWQGEPENRQSIHVYCDARNFSEALLGAVCKVVEKRGVENLGYSRLDAVTNADADEFSRKLVRRLEPERIVDHAHMRAVGAYLREKHVDEDKGEIE